jgi:ribonuclease P protein component
VLYAFPRDDDNAETEGAEGGEVRFGVSVGRRVGGAVERNHVKRLLREAFWSVSDLVSESHDYVVVARKGSAEAAGGGGLEAFRSDLTALLERLRESEGPEGGRR